MKVNGSPALAGAVAADAPLTPIVGRVRARIAYPMLAEPEVRGRFGRAWWCNLSTIRARLPKGAPPDAMVAHWVIEAPWSHQVVHSYSLMVVHLRHMMGRPPPPKLIPGASHEVCLQAIHPEAPRERFLGEPADPRAWIEPMTFAAQIAESSDEAATIRVARAVGLVCEGRLSPHPSHARAWAEIFGDNMLARAALPARNSSTEVAE